MPRPSLDRCPASGTPILYADDPTGKRRMIAQARCKLWSCAYCGEVNAHQHYIRIINGCNRLLNKGQQLSFITITSHEKLKTQEACLRVWRSAWKRLRERIRRLHNKTSKSKLAFVLVTEAHKDGRLHWHGIVNCIFSTRWLKDSARACGLGYQCKSIPMDNAGQSVSYVTKYLGKSIQNEMFAPKMRRIVYSESFPSMPKRDSSYEWHVAEAKESIVSLIEYAWFVKNYDTYLEGKKIDEIIDGE